MADSATQFQAPSIMQGYNYTPVKGGDLGGSHLQGMGTGELWAGVGRTALDAASKAGAMLQDSMLNPMVKAQAQAQIAASQGGVAHQAWLKAHGNPGQMTEGTDAQGNAVSVPAAEQNIDPQVRLALRSNAPPTTATTPAPDPAAPPPAPGPETPPGTFLNPATGSIEQLQSAQPTPTTAQPKGQPHKDPGDVLENKTTFAGPNPSNTDAAIKEALTRNQFASSDQGVPADYRPPPQPGGSIYSPMRPAPMAPPAPVAAAPPPVDPAVEKQQKDQALQLWQNKTQGLPMTADDAMQWMGGRTTLATGATFLANGGPNGEPAFAFHMKTPGGKGGGTNIVPVSQMVQNGAGPAIAAQNTSIVLSASDRMQQQKQNALAAPPDQPPPVQPPPLQPGPNGAPPAAPGPAQVAQAGPPGPPPAPVPAPGAYDPAPYRMPQGPTTTQAGGVNPALMAGGDDAQAAAGAKAPLPPIPQVDSTDFNANVKGYSMQQLANMKQDPSISDGYGGFNWKQDKTYGTKYAVMRSPDGPFRELRWNAGMDGWQNTLKENGGLMQQVQAARANTPFEKVEDDTDISNMSPEDLKSALDEAVRFHATGGDESSTTSLHIRGNIQQSKSLARMIDTLEQARQAGIPASEYSRLAEDQSKGAAERDAITSDVAPKNPIDLLRRGIAGWHDWEADGGGTHPIADHLTREAKFFGEQMAQTPGLEYSTGEKPQNKTTQFMIAGIPIQLPMGTDTSSLQQVNRIFSNAKDPQEVIDGLKDVKHGIDSDIKDSTDRATRMGYRTPPQFRNAASKIQNGSNIDDDTPRYVPKSGTSTRSTSSPTVATSGATPGPTPFETDAATKFIKSAKPGTPFDWKDSKGIIHHMTVD